MGNIVMAQGGIPIQQGMYEESITKKAELGRLLPMLDGRCFRYCQSDGGMTRGHMCSGAEVDSNMNTVTQTGMTVTISGGSIGAKVIKVLLGAATTANLYEDGLLVIEGGVGLGYAYRIKSNKAGGAAVATACELTLYDPLVVALDATAIISLTKNRFKDVIVTPVSETAAPVGVPLIDVTDNYYFWAQTKGYAPVVVGDSETINVGQQAAIDDTDPGAVANRGSYTEKAWGVIVQIAAADTYATIDLALE